VSRVPRPSQGPAEVKTTAEHVKMTNPGANVAAVGNREDIMGENPLAMTRNLNVGSTQFFWAATIETIRSTRAR
jgi:hypothetical protein